MVLMVLMVPTVPTVPTERGRFMKYTFSLVFFALLSPVFVLAAGPKPPRPHHVVAQAYTNLPRTKAGLKRFLRDQCLKTPPESIDYSRGTHMPKGHLPAQCEGKLMSYQVCRALVAKSTKPCATFQKSCGSKGVFSCQRRYEEDMFIASMVSNSPEAVSLCLKTIPPSASIPMDQRRRLCSAMLQGIKQRMTPSELCAKLGMTDPSCKHQFAYLAGPNACTGMSKWGSAYAEHCKDMAAMVRSKGDPALCGDSAVCKGLLSISHGDTCAPLKKAMQEALELKQKAAVHEYCVGFVKYKFSEMIHQEATFRKINHLPPYKDGDKFINFLPQNEKEKYYNKKQERAEELKYFHKLKRFPMNQKPPQGPPPSDSQE